MSDLRRRVAALTKRIGKPETGCWWSEIEDVELEYPACFYLSAVLGHMLDAEADLPVYESALPTPAEINRWLASQGLEPVPLSDVHEFTNVAGHFVHSRHYRPIAALALAFMAWKRPEAS